MHSTQNRSFLKRNLSKQSLALEVTTKLTTNRRKYTKKTQVKT